MPRVYAPAAGKRRLWFSSHRLAVLVTWGYKTPVLLPATQEGLRQCPKPKNVESTSNLQNFCG
eukprot:1726362-Amphidinium_carterae.1